jgi:hypothetical protein
MALVLNSVQCFAITILLFGFLGFLRGWQRMVVVMGFTLAAVLFLFIGSANGIAEIFFVRLPQTINILTGGAIGPKSPPPPSPTEVLISALITLGIAVILGFAFSDRGFPILTLGNIKFTAHTSDRFIGIIPGMITGYAIISYLSHLFASNPNIAVGLTAPSTSSLGGYIVVIVVIAVIAIIIGLLTTRFGK